MNVTVQLSYTPVTVQLSYTLVTPVPPLTPITHPNSRAQGLQAIVTGANAGIGREVAKTLARHGVDVHMLARSAERNEQARREIIAELEAEGIRGEDGSGSGSGGGGGSIGGDGALNSVSGTGTNSGTGQKRGRLVTHTVDVSHLDDVIAFARSWRDSARPLHILVNNAGVLLGDGARTLTPDWRRLEVTFATNSLATYALTREFLPHMAHSSGSKWMLGGCLVAVKWMMTVNCRL